MKTKPKDRLPLKWRVQLTSLLHEIVESNNSNWIFRQPFMILKSILLEVAERAIEINDPKLNKLMMRLAIYEQGDPTLEGYSQEFYDKSMRVEDDKYPNLRASAPELLEALQEVQRINSGESNGGNKADVHLICEQAIKKATS